ncbi:MAG: c-type cytochrome [Burkholderiaceae bacterium]|nr:c-type cytochrome [Burkholderiaceae bacterium]
MKPWLRTTGVALLSAGVLLGAAAATLDWGAQARSKRRIEVNLRPLPDAVGEPSPERGRYLFVTRGCAGCHGNQGGGRPVVDDGQGMRVVAPTIAPGPGSSVAGYAAADWDRVIRHGIKPDGTPVLIMPSEDTARLTDADLRSLVRHLGTLPPAARPVAAEVRLPFPVCIAYALGLMPDAAARIDHAAPAPAPVDDGVSIEHGRYVADLCRGCHGEHLSGGRVPSGPPDWPPAANLTPGPDGLLPRYASLDDFRRLMRQGRRPDGSAIGAAMPIGSLGALNDTDLAALHLYLRSLAPRASGGG